MDHVVSLPSKNFPKICENHVRSALEEACRREEAPSLVIAQVLKSHIGLKAQTSRAYDYNGNGSLILGDVTYEGGNGLNCRVMYVLHVAFREYYVLIEGREEDKDVASFIASEIDEMAQKCKLGDEWGGYKLMADNDNYPR